MNQGVRIYPYDLDHQVAKGAQKPPLPPFPQVLPLNFFGFFGVAETPIVPLALSTYASDDDVYRAVEAGAAGYPLTDAFLPTLAEAIRAVHAGKQFFPPAFPNCWLSVCGMRS